VSYQKRLSLLLPPLVLLALVSCQDSAGITSRRPKIEVTPNPVVFDTVPRGVRAERILTVTNAGDFALDISQIDWTANPSGDFTLVDVESMPDVIEAGEASRFVVAFTPSSLDVVTAALRIVSDDPETPEVTVEVRGDRRQGPVLVTCLESEDIPLSLRCPDPAELDFGDVNVQETSTAKIVLRSEGTDPVQVSALALSDATDGAFTIETASTSFTLPVGAQHVVTVRYAPVQQLAATGALVVSSNDPDRGTTTTTIEGNGAEAWLCLNPKTLDFGNVGVGQEREGTIEIANCGSGGETVRIEAMEILGEGGPYSVVNAPSEPVDLPAIEGIAYTAKIRYAPTLEGETTGRFRVRADRGTATAPLTGTSAGCQIEAFPTQLSISIFDGRGTVTFSNLGGEACAIDALTLDDPNGAFFLEEDRVPETLASGDTLLAHVFFGAAPMDEGVTADLKLSYRPADDATATLTDKIVPITGSTGPIEPIECSTLRVEPSSLRFGAVAPGTSRVVGFEAVDCVDTITMKEGSDPAFTVEAGSTPYRLRFSPTAEGIAMGTVVVTSTDEDVDPVEVPVTAFGGASGLCIEPTNVDFGEVQTEATQSFTLRACGSFPVTVTQLSWTRADPEISIVTSPTLPLVLDAGDTHTIDVRYAPLDNAGDTAIIEVVSDDPVRPSIDVRVTGGPSIVPPSAGRFLYFWHIDPAGIGSNIRRQPLQGDLTVEPFAGPEAGNEDCAGCHAVSPDGRFVAITAQSWVLKFYDAETKSEFLAPLSLSDGQYVSWNPNVETDPPYQFVYATGGGVEKASLFTGELGTVTPADVGYATMPSWGPDGTIAFVSADGGSGPVVSGQANLFVVPEDGGAVTALAGASSNGQANYYPAFSPNGQWIAFTQSASGESSFSAADARVRLVRADNSGEVLTLDAANGNVGASSYPTWARDGTHLSFASTRPGGLGSWDLYLLPLDPVTGAPGTPFPLTQANTNGFEHAAQWSP
jgi:hypothetical protein